MKETHTAYSCDKCGKRLRTDKNSLDIVTSLSEDVYWSRLHVQIIHTHGIHTHGIHNDGTTEPAELCRQCTVDLLKNALKRIQKGERATAGTEGIEQGGWS